MASGETLKGKVAIVTGGASGRCGPFAAKLMQVKDPSACPEREPA
jgi:hypothetical protein